MPHETLEESKERAIMVHAMMLACFADGSISSQQVALVECYAKSLPEFQDRDFKEYYEAAKEIASEAGGSTDLAVGLLSHLGPEGLRRKTFLCAMELAWCDGLTEKEEKLLMAMQEVLGVDPVLARAAQTALEVKFSSHQTM